MRAASTIQEADETPAPLGSAPAPPAAAPGGDRVRRLRRLARRASLVVASSILVLVGLLAASAWALSGNIDAEVLELRGTLGESRTLNSWEDAASSFRHIELRNDRGEAIAEALVRRPLAPTANPWVLVTYTGTGTGEQILDFIPARDDLVLLAVQYPFERPRERWQRLQAPFQVRGAAVRTAAGGLLAVDYLEREEGLDADRILLLGASVGSIFANLHGAIDERIQRVLIVHGGGDLPSILRASLEGNVPGWLLPAAVRLARIPTDSFDPVRYVHRIAPRELLVVAARQDSLFPPATVERYYDMAGEPKKLLWTETSHVGNKKPDIVTVVLEVLTAYLDGESTAT